MRITGMGKFVLFLLIVGIAIGGWRFYQQQNGSATPFKLPSLSSNNNNTSATANKSENASGNFATGALAAQDNEILLLTSATKRGWLLDQIEKFNQENQGKYRVTTKFMETRDAMHAILQGDVQPAIWSPSSTIWTARLATAWKADHERPILNLDDPTSYRVFFRSPLVFLTTKEKLPKLKPILGSGWDKLRAASANLKFSHADPLTANSGMMTLGLILADYAQQTNSDPNDVASTTKFRAYLQGLERGLVFDLPAQGGSSALFKAFVADPNRYDFITTYESNAIDEAMQNRKVAVIYPNPTAVSESVGAVLQGDWLSNTQQEGAREFLKFLGSDRSTREGLAYHFRPARSGGTLSLNNTLSNLRNQGFQPGFSAVELPPYDALNSAAFQWKKYVAPKVSS